MVIAGIWLVQSPHPRKKLIFCKGSFMNLQGGNEFCNASLGHTPSPSILLRTDGKKTQFAKQIVVNFAAFCSFAFVHIPEKHDNKSSQAMFVFCEMN